MPFPRLKIKKNQSTNVLAKTMISTAVEEEEKRRGKGEDLKETWERSGWWLTLSMRSIKDAIERDIEDWRSGEEGLLSALTDWLDRMVLRMFSHQSNISSLDVFLVRGGITFSDYGRPNVDSLPNKLGILCIGFVPCRCNMWNWKTLRKRGMSAVMLTLR